MQTKIYEVGYEARKHGSIGIFGNVTRRVMANTESEAKEAAFRVLHLDDYETNHVNWVHDTGETVDIPE